MNIQQLLNDVTAHDGASDIFIIAGLPITYKAKGRQSSLDTNRLIPTDTLEIAQQVYGLANRDPTILFDLKGDDDFSFMIPSLGRFRANVFHQRNSVALVIRIIFFGIPDPTTLGIPEEVLRIASFTKGLVLVTGTTGSGKSTLLSCLIDRINSTREGHIVTIEDPIEFIHHHNRCIVSQREIGSDVTDFDKALRSAVRESADTILLGEMRDKKTIQNALRAAESGKLLLSSLQTICTSSTIDRIIEEFPEAAQQQIRVSLGIVLRAIISEQLVPAVDGELVPAFEVMIANTAIRNLIREAKTYQIDSSISAGTDQGMITMDQSLFRLCKKGRITSDVALQHSIHYEALRRKLTVEKLL
jgi:twitching motility protein PilT